MFSQEYEEDVTEVFDENSTQGNLLLDFMTHSVNFRGTAGQARIDKVLSFILDHTIDRDGKRLGKKIDVLLVISKWALPGHLGISINNRKKEADYRQ